MHPGAIFRGVKHETQSLSVKKGLILLHICLPSKYIGPIKNRQKRPLANQSARGPQKCQSGLLFFFLGGGVFLIFLTGGPFGAFWRKCQLQPPRSIGANNNKNRHTKCLPPLESDGCIFFILLQGTLPITPTLNHRSFIIFAKQPNSSN